MGTNRSNLRLIVVAAVFVLMAYLCSVMVMRVGDVSFTAPFRYTGLIWVLVLGYVIWGDWPTPLTLLGAGIVVAMGLYRAYGVNLGSFAKISRTLSDEIAKSVSNFFSPL